MQITCKCGEILRNNEIPNCIQLILYTDYEWDKITTPVSINTCDIPVPQHDVWRCPKCERLYFFKNGITKAEKVYRLEE